jgi:hypothetical protein
MRPPVFDNGIVETRRVMDSGRIMVLDGRWDAAARRLLRCVTRRAAYSVKHRNRDPSDVETDRDTSDFHSALPPR